MSAPADATLPEDIIVEILSRVGDAVAVVRCAATCKAWRRLILEPYFLSRHRTGPSSLLGFLFRDTSQKPARRRRYLRRPTRFLLLGSSQPQATTVLDLSHFLPDAGGLSGFNTVASGAGGLLALRRVRHYSCDPVRICVCDGATRWPGPPPFSPPLDADVPTYCESFVCLDADGSSFRLLAAMDHQPRIILRVFSSRIGQWGTAVTAQLPDNVVLCVSSPAVVHRGAVHWICGTRYFGDAEHALAVRPGEAEVSVSRLDLPPRAGKHSMFPPWEVRLSSSSQGCLSLVHLDRRPVISIWNFQDDVKSWVLHKTISDYPSANRWDSIEGLCGQSGSLFLRVSGEGLFVLNLETEMMSKVWHDHYHEYEYECPYTLDLRSCLGAMKSF